MRSTEEDGNDRTVYCGNLSDEVTEAILYELFNQAGPVESVRRAKDQNGRPKTFAFITYKHECSVPYALQLFIGEKLFNRSLILNSRSTLNHIPVLDTHLSEFTEHAYHGSSSYRGYDSSRERNRGFDSPRDRIRSYDSPRDRERGYDSPRERGYNSLRDRGRRSDFSDKHENSQKKEKDPNEPKSWAELNALRGKGSLLNSYQRNDLQQPPVQREYNGPSPVVADFNALLQMGQQMMLPGTLGGMSMMGGGLSPLMFPSMQGRMSGGERSSPDRDRRRKDYHDDRGSRRDHPYDNRHSDQRQPDHHVHRRHDRGYSSSRSSHERERRNRRSR